VTPSQVSVAAELRAYLAGWDDAIECFLETLSWVPDEQLPFVIRESARRRKPIVTPVGDDQ